MVIDNPPDDPPIPPDDSPIPPDDPPIPPDDSPIPPDDSPIPPDDPPIPPDDPPIPPDDPPIPPDDSPIPPDDPPIPPDDPPIPPGYFYVQFTIAITSKYRHEHSIRTLNQIDAVAFLWDDEERMMDVRDFVDMPGSAYRLLKENPLDSFFLKEINIGDGKVEVWISTSNSSTTFILL